jgi:hypothetical protein
VRDWKDTGAACEAGVLDGAMNVNALLGRQVLTMPQVGAPTSSGARVLNPRFVEALMGWPDAWTDCASWETESCPSKRNSRSACSGTVSSEAA